MQNTSSFLLLICQLFHAAKNAATIWICSIVNSKGAAEVLEGSFRLSCRHPWAGPWSTLSSYRLYYCYHPFPNCAACLECFTSYFTAFRACCVTSEAETPQRLKHESEFMFKPRWQQRFINNGHRLIDTTREEQQLALSPLWNGLWNNVPTRCQTTRPLNLELVIRSAALCVSDSDSWSTRCPDSVREHRRGGKGFSLHGHGPFEGLLHEPAARWHSNNGLMMPKMGLNIWGGVDWWALHLSGLF